MSGYAEEAAEVLLRELEILPGDSKTPARFVDWLKAMTVGLCVDPKDELRTQFPHKGTGMLVEKGMPFYSLCEHHLVPFFGVVHVGYIPDGWVVGLSKLPRMVDLTARRLLIQERLTDDILANIVETVPNRGVIVVVDAEHLCVSSRGARAQGTRTRTVAVHGDVDVNLFFKLLEV